MRISDWSSYVCSSDLVLGQPVPRRQRALLELRKGIGVLLQGNGLLTDLTAAENVALPLRTHTKLPRPVIDRLVAMKLHAVGLRTAGELYPRELSGGMARRVALARRSAEHTSELQSLMSPSYAAFC